MKNRPVERTLMLAVILAASLSTLSAQAQQGGCEGMEGFGDFDFWLGDWTVFDNATGMRAGRNSIQKQEQGCLLMEHWLSNGGGTGTSLNYFNPVLGEWRQLWVSAGRYAIDIAGGLRDGSMVLTGRIYPFNGAAADFRGTWTPAEDGSVRQFFEQFNAATQQWDAWFDGRYVRAE